LISPGYRNCAVPIKLHNPKKKIEQKIHQKSWGFFAGKLNDHPDNPFKSVQSYDQHKAHTGKPRFVFSLVFFVVPAFVEVATDLYKKKIRKNLFSYNHLQMTLKEQLVGNILV
jgi:hypothetical protein